MVEIDGEGGGKAERTGRAAKNGSSRHWKQREKGITETWDDGMRRSVNRRGEGERGRRRGKGNGRGVRECRNSGIFTFKLHGFVY
jgi:hypothetical protein